MNNKYINNASRKSQYFHGIKCGIPILLGYLAVSFTFGIAAKKIGMTTFQCAVMSLTNLTSAGQFASLAIISTNSSFFELALTEFIINLRYSLMSSALSQKLSPKMPHIHRFIMGYGVTDEVFGVSILQDKPLSPYFFYGTLTCAVPAWVIGTTLGAAAGSILPANVLSALGIALYGMFISIIVTPSKKDIRILCVVCISFMLSLIFSVTPFLKQISSGFKVIIIAVIVCTGAAILFPVKEEETEEKKEGE